MLINAQNATSALDASEHFVVIVWLAQERVLREERFRKYNVGPHMDLERETSRQPVFAANALCDEVE